MLQGSSARAVLIPHQTIHSTKTYSGNTTKDNASAHYGDNISEHYRDRITNNFSGPSESASEQCLRDLQVTDPRVEKVRIEGEKDILLKQCYAWILADKNFQRWRTQDDARLLWIKGDPGMGKTMMMIGVIAELSHARSSQAMSSQEGAAPETGMLDDEPTSLLSYFFCQNTIPTLNNAVSVLRGLIYMLVVQKQCLLRHVEERYRVAGKQLFDGHNAIHSLQSILLDVLNDKSLPPTYLLVDALDECTSGLRALLQVITDASLTRRSRVKWLVTSRKSTEIGRYLQPDSRDINVNLELKASHVSQAVAAFVDYKVQRLVSIRHYDDELQAEVQQQLREKAEGTFLWVSLVCKELEDVPLWRTREVLQAVPPRLESLYKRMMSQIEASDIMTAQYCKGILEIMSLAFRPLQLEELAVAAGLPRAEFSNVQAVSDLVRRCGSFLPTHNGVVSFVHLSAKDYFTKGSGGQMFNDTTANKHRQVTERLLDAMDSMLHLDMCKLQKPGVRMREVLATGRIEKSSLPKIAYACEYWTEHLQAGMLCYNPVLTSNDWLYMFLWTYSFCKQGVVVVYGLMYECIVVCMYKCVI
jgi:hypothetical protein